MPTTQGNLFTLNGAQYDGNHLPKEGKHLLGLITEAQNELIRLETRKALLQAAQQQLINQLKPLMPSPIHSQPPDTVGIIGSASMEIPTTPVEKPDKHPASLPDNLPEAIKSKHP